ncbi:MAG TPA: hypothetical protein VNU19_04090 [Candidatus Acidoferrum sp.]|nr:hypothetical protein [Candidatus Acidoferrum sp.]
MIERAPAPTRELSTLLQASAIEWLLSGRLVELATLSPSDLGRGDGPGGGRAPSALEQRLLAEHRAGADLGAAARSTSADITCRSPRTLR